MVGGDVEEGGCPRLARGLERLPERTHLLRYAACGAAHGAEMAMAYAACAAHGAEVTMAYAFDCKLDLSSAARRPAGQSTRWLCRPRPDRPVTNNAKEGR